MQARYIFCLTLIMFLASTGLAFGYTVIELADNVYDFTQNITEPSPEYLGPFPVLEYRDAYYVSGKTGDWTTTGSGFGGTSTTLWTGALGAKMTTKTTVASTVVIFCHNGDANDGLMDLYVDGVKYASLDNNSNPGKTWAIAVMGLPETVHTMEAVSVGYHPGTSYKDIHLLGGAAADLPDPMPLKVEPASGPASGGEAVTISGLGFLEGASIIFGTSPVFMVQSLDFYTITLTTPPGKPGLQDIVITNPHGAEGTLEAAYTYESECGGIPQPANIHQINPKNVSFMLFLLPFMLLLPLKFRK